MKAKLNFNTFALVLIVFSLLIGCKSSKNEVFKNEPDGFGGYKWRTQFSDIPRLEIGSSPVTSLGLYHYATYKTTDGSSIDGIFFSDIEYLFDKNLLNGVIIKLSSKHEFENVKMHCFNKYGERTNSASTKDSDIYDWNGSVTRITLISTTDNNKEYGYLILQSVTSEKQPFIYSEIEWVSESIESMQSLLLLNKSVFCTYLSTDLELPEEYENIDAHLCKLFEISDEKTKNTFRMIKDSRYVNPDYYYFSVFLETDVSENETYTGIFYEENEIGLFENLDECNQVSQYAESNNLPIRRCRSWKSHSDYIETLDKYLFE